MMRSKKLAFTIIGIAVFLLAASFLPAQSPTANLKNIKVTVVAKDDSISTVLQTLISESGCNIVMANQATTEKDKKDERRLTISLRDIPIEEAVALVAKSVGLSYRLVGSNTFLVGEKSNIEEEVGERGEIIKLKYADAATVAKALEVMPGKTVELKGSNALLVKANPQTIGEIENLISQFDTAKQQIEIRARLIEVSVEDSKELGIDWSRLNHLTTIFAEDPYNADGFGLPYNYANATDGLSHGDAINFGELPETQYFQKMDSWDNQFHFSRQLYAFDVTMDWLMQNNAARLLTDTRVTAMNGESATIKIGEMVPYVAIDKENNYQVEREDVGIKLTVSPKVNDDGQITTTILPEVSSVMELVGGYIPHTKIRTVSSTITVPNGCKILVGGLLSNNLVTTVDKVPFLGDIPYIGSIFRHKVEKLTTTDLIIEITPTIVNVEEQQLPENQLKVIPQYENGRIYDHVIKSQKEIDEEKAQSDASEAQE
jgi:type IV pilus assembly protein PilQ